MAVSYKLPKIKNVDRVIVLNDPAVADITLASGTLSIVDENAINVFKEKISRLAGYKVTATGAGTAGVYRIALASVPLVGFTTQRLTISLPNRIDFFGGGKEQSAVFEPRTYIVSTDAAPTAAELATAFKAAIDADLDSGVTAAINSSTNLDITCVSALSGGAEFSIPVGATLTVTTANVLPVGRPAEIAAYGVNPATITAATYNRILVSKDKLITQNVLSGNSSIKRMTDIIYMNTAATDFAVSLAELQDILSGAYTPVADYLGTPTM